MRAHRVLFYTVNGLGLGHVTRLLAIARKLRTLAPNAEILFFTSSEAEDVIFREGFAAIKVPSKTVRSQGRLRSTTYAKLLQTVTLNVMASFHPHVLVVDTFPAGTLQELLPVLRWDGRRVFVYRVQRPEVALAPLMQNTLPLYDRVIVPHNRDEVEIPLPDGVDAVWTGPILIRDRNETLSREEARRRLGLPRDGLIVYICFGGGGDPQMDEALRTTVACLHGNDAHLAVAHAPLFRGVVPRGPGVTIVDHYPMAEMFSAFDAAISAAGYNSTMELLHHGVPTALVPFPRQVDDQHARARHYERTGAAICVSELTPERLRSAFDRLLDEETRTRLATAASQQVAVNRAERAAEAIAELFP